jgi:uncharacterized metal-binding protein YceD (DUF177 family)
LPDGTGPALAGSFVMSGYILDLTTLPNGPSQVEAEAGAEALGLAAADWPGGVRGSFGVEKTADRISVRGTLEARARLECVGCLTVFEQPMRVPFEVFAERSGTGSRRDEEALDRDAYMKFHDGRRLDLGPDVRETLLLEMPIAPRCREDCAGLCPVCGADRNLGPHDCPGTRNEESIHGGSQA